MIIYAIPSLIVGGIAGSFGYGFTDWQHWACLLPVAIASGLLYAARG